MTFIKINFASKTPTTFDQGFGLKHFKRDTVHFFVDPQIGMNELTRKINDAKRVTNGNSYIFVLESGIYRPKDQGKSQQIRSINGQASLALLEFGSKFFPAVESVFDKLDKAGILDNSSAVPIQDAQSPYFDRVGNVLLMDLDGMDLSGVMWIVDYIEKKFRLNCRWLIAETNKGYHVYGLDILSFNQVLGICEEPMINKYIDPEHVKLLKVNGETSLRLSSTKWSKDNPAKIVKEILPKKEERKEIRDFTSFVKRFHETDGIVSPIY